MLRKPSLKTLKLHWDESDALIIRKELNACKYPQDVYKALQRISKSLNQFGVETIVEDDKVLGQYINTGDTYSSTILFNHLSNTIISTTFGDFVEYLERRGYRDLRT